MRNELNDALLIIRKACSSVVADYDTHQAIQSALRTIEDKLEPRELEKMPKDSTEE
jgi:hypothetical protein